MESYLNLFKSTFKPVEDTVIIKPPEEEKSKEEDFWHDFIRKAIEEHEIEEI